MKCDAVIFDLYETRRDSRRSIADGWGGTLHTHYGALEAEQ